MLLKRAAVCVLLLVAFAFSFAGCNANEAKPQAATGEQQHSKTTPHWSQE